MRSTGFEKGEQMHYKALIFDLDGTLLDTLADLADAANRVLASMGMPTHHFAAYRHFVGNGLHTLITRILPETERTDRVIKEAVLRFTEDYSHHWQVKTCMYDGIEDMLNILNSREYPMSILSNKPHQFTLLCVEQLLSSWKFSPIVGLGPENPPKPDPAAALLIAKTLKFDPSQILFVGDSSVDMQTATNAGMDAVGVLWGFRTADELHSNGARYLIKHPNQLPNIV